MNQISSVQLNETTLEHLIPFHLIWESSGNLIRISTALRKFWKLPADTPLVISLERPFKSELNYRLFPELTDMMLTLSTESAPDRHLRAELIALGDGKWLLSGLPPLGRVSDLENAGLKLSDLPLHTGLGDALIAAEASQISLDESVVARKKLEEANRSLLAINEAFGRFVPRPFLKALGVDSPMDANLGAHSSASTTIMFADLRNFTAISEEMQSEEIFSFINRYLARVAPRIRENEGFVVHYLGDGILALFQGPPENPIRAAIEMQRAFRDSVRSGELTVKRRQDLDLRLGIGLHFGHIEMGIVGESGRWDSSVISDAVNIASRVENMTKRYGAEILITGEMSARLAAVGAPRVRRIGQVDVKGKQGKVDVYEVLDSLPEATFSLRINSLVPFEEAVRAFERNDKALAREGFQRCLGVDPSDRAAQYYLFQLSDWAH